MTARIIDFLEPWVALTDAQRSRFEEELRRELTPGHVLAGAAFRAIARRQDCDDVLFELVGDGVAVVHLTWSRETDARWPRTERFASLAEWAERRMKPDHEDFV